MPHRGREPRENVLDLRGERRRRDRLGQDAEAGAFRPLLRRGSRAHRSDERRPREDLSHLRQRPHAIGIVEIEQCRLREDIGCAEAGGMRRVALNFRRAPFVALDEQPGRAAAERHRRCVEQRPARNDVFGLAHVRKNLLGRLARAAGHTREGERCPHQFQKRAPLDRVERLGQPRRKLVADELVEVGAMMFFERPPELGRAARPALTIRRGFHR